jgi:hypothetical protein
MSMRIMSGTLVAGLGSALSLVALWLRLRWRTRQERKESLVAIAHAMRRGGRIEERQSDGTWLCLIVDQVRTGREEP